MAGNLSSFSVILWISTIQVLSQGILSSLHYMLSNADGISIELLPGSLCHVSDLKLFCEPLM